MSAPGGATRVAGVIGDPIAHSLSPALHNAAFRAARLDWVFVAFPVPEGGGEAAVHAASTLGLGGLSVTMPHKEAAAAACDALTDDAALLGAVNVVVVHDDRSLLGASTDGPGFVRAIREADVTVDGAEVVVVGAGGAARALTLALGRAGAGVTVAARRADAAEAAASLAPGAHGVALGEADGLLARADVVVNATPVGMRDDAMPIDPALLPERCYVFDIIYHPVETALLAAARARGLRGANGLGMLVHQAALAFELWTGRDAPVDAMWRALR